MRRVRPIYTSSGIIPLVVSPVFSMNQWKSIGECSYLISSYPLCTTEKPLHMGTLMEEADKIAVVYSIYILGIDKLDNAGRSITIACK